ncbi:hypothetical protein ABIF52_000678 [Bradyrhizobium japonicum]
MTILLDEMREAQPGRLAQLNAFSDQAALATVVLGCLFDRARGLRSFRRAQISRPVDNSVRSAIEVMTLRGEAIRADQFPSWIRRGQLRGSGVTPDELTA